MIFRNLVFGFALLMAVVTQTRAQNIRLGLEAGANLSNFSGQGVTGISGTLSSKIGLTGGAFFQANLGPVFAIELEALYAQKGTVASSGSNATYDFSYFQFPLLLKYYFPTPEFKPNVFLGASVGIKTLSQLVTNGGSAPLTAVSGSDIGLIGGVGVDIKKFSVNMRYELGLSDIDTSSTSIQNGTFTLLVGYSFI